MDKSNSSETGNEYLDTPITVVSPLPLVRPVQKAPVLVRPIPEGLFWSIEHHWADGIVSSMYLYSKAVSVVISWIPTIVKLLYWWLVMDIASILRFIVTFITGWLFSKWPALQSITIFDTPLSEIIFIGFAAIGGIFLPQARSFVPKWLRDILGWKTKEEQEGR